MPDLPPPEPPLGKLVQLTALTWEGPPPVPGDWTGTPMGRTSYEIVEVRPRRTQGFVLRCRRWRRGTEPMEAAARFRIWCWAPREPRNA